MKGNARIVAYFLLLACVIASGYGFFSGLAKAGKTPSPGVVTNTLSNTGESSPAQVRSGKLHWGYFGLFVFASLSLAILVAYDGTHYLAQRVEEFVFEPEGEVRKDPEYEEAEQLWANGQFLDAIQHMRDFLEHRPQAQYAALRIAEIYEKDLGNPVAAALEYQEILKKRLPPERWGWTAIHLANIYSGKMNKTADAEALLRRIISEYSSTAAARKARERLGEPEPAPEETTGSVPEASSTPQTPPASNLPPGFRPK